MELKRIIEAILFISPKPVRLKKLFRKLEGHAFEDIEKSVNELKNDYNYSDRALEIVEVSGGYQIRTKVSYREWVKRFVKERDAGLTRSMLETLSIVAYKQPITKREIDNFRGVDSARMMKQLLERRLIEIAGRNGDLGRKIVFRTTGKFLELYGLKDIGDLPTFKEIESLEQ
ncbi:MAG: SMC-Scp complex subunit ScpB [Proteobacteria bacterium]|nr:SMC-Scp complex subunit ScpB [Pseudomonadota bacterium]